MTISTLCLLLLVGLAIACGAVRAQSQNDPKLGAVLESIRGKYRLPALAGAIFTTDGVVDMATTGVRKAGTDIPVTTDDLWHLGSDTKIMTATLAGTFVAEKKLSWGDKVSSFFPEIAEKIPASIEDITIAQVLSHQAGLSENLSLWNRAFLTGSIMEQRRKAAELILESPAYAPGAFHYANNDYILIGAILEKISGQSWEDLMRERIFGPLKMESAGFGGTGTIGQIDQPWPHFANGEPAPENGPETDNAAYMGPCGSVHCSMADWAKFLADQLRGGSGMTALLPPEIYAALQTPAANSDYGFGWRISQRSWANGKMLSHAGSNTMNYAACWLGPARGMGVLVCSNQAGDALPAACNEAAEAMMSIYFKTSRAQPSR
jgi:CubicO group peptidase (beta-lactamase class C family)